MPTLPSPSGDDLVYIALCDAHERFLSVNAPYAARLGLEPADVVGRRIADVLQPAAYQAVSPYIQKALRGEAVEFTAESPDAYLEEMERDLPPMVVARANLQPDKWDALRSDLQTLYVETNESESAFSAPQEYLLTKGAKS
jgi:PAS domain-containing protein